MRPKECVEFFISFDYSPNVPLLPVLYLQLTTCVLIFSSSQYRITTDLAPYCQTIGYIFQIKRFLSSIVRQGHEIVNRQYSLGLEGKSLFCTSSRQNIFSLTVQMGLALYSFRASYQFCDGPYLIKRFDSFFISFLGTCVSVIESSCCSIELIVSKETIENGREPPFTSLTRLTENHDGMSGRSRQMAHRSIKIICKCVILRFFITSEKLEIFTKDNTIKWNVYLQSVIRSEGSE